MNRVLNWNQRCLKAELSERKVLACCMELKSRGPSRNLSHIYKLDRVKAFRIDAAGIHHDVVVRAVAVVVCERMLRIGELGDAPVGNIHIMHKRETLSKS